MKKIRLFVILSFLMFMCSYLNLSVISAEGAENCVASGCHDNLQKKPYVHGPVRGRNCVKCHGGDDHPYPLIKKKEEICYLCHKSIASKKHVHPPVKEDCLSCHNPHASNHENLLNEEKEKLCMNCHDNKGFTNKVIHPPVKENCMSCHYPHDSDYPKLVKDEGKKLCYNCHEQKDVKKHVHPPVKEGDCLGCHNPHSTPGKALLKQEGNELCFICHDNNDYVGKQNVHMPVKEDCKNCHLPHDSDNARLLNKDNVCVECHGTMVNGKVVHPPVGDKDCTGCHSPHTSNETKLLSSPIPTLCFNCHDKAPFTKKNIHPPVQEACTSCHLPHSSGYTKLLITKKEFLCNECHSEIISNFKKYKFSHPPVRDGQCEACHVVHSSDAIKILKDMPVFLCSECHDLGDTKTAKSIHKPVENGKCADCHGVHGGDIIKFLNEPFPAENYPPYSRQTYAFCFKCHNNDIARDPKTLTATNFRNGDKNLHYVHVNKDKSRNCRFCHDPHLSSQEKLIKPSFVSFGSWNIPINYTKNQNGGGCIVGCHKPFYYDRVKPVKNQ